MKTVKGKRKDGYKVFKTMEMASNYRDLSYVCCLIWPWSHVKLEKIQQVIEHYSAPKDEGKVVNLEDINN